MTTNNNSLNRLMISVNLRYFTGLFLVFIGFFTSYAQDTYKRNNHVDVQHYVFNLTLSDEDNEIEGMAEIAIDFDKVTDTFSLDLVKKSGKYGMEVSQVLEDGSEVDFTFANNKLMIYPSKKEGLDRTYLIGYKGIPQYGLVIDTTKYGQRSFFGDNWPNKARYWLPCVDHPYDKASVEFKVTAPEDYDVVATGKKVEESNLGNATKLTSYKEMAPVATKVMTIGVTKFAMKNLGSIDDIEVSAWVYPENRMEGFTDFEESTEIMNYFINSIGPYAYAKLANMQVKTQWGGLENAGTISYNEKVINGKKGIQQLMAHEIAHQWFGDAVTESDWNHVWLSEGFATYFAILYQESVLGNEKRMEELIQDRIDVIKYYAKNPSSVIDISIRDPRKVLNTNSYQKGGWMLNMLRHKLGEEIFWQGITSYYQQYMNGNVMTKDFQDVMEQVSGEDLQAFFEQWLYVKGYPEIAWKWKYKKGKLKITLDQLQSQFTFNFPVEFGVHIDGVRKIHTAYVESKSSSFEFDVKSKPEFVEIDPEVWLLFQEKSN